MKDIIIIANFCRDFSENDNGRFLFLCKEITRECHECHVEIITSDFSHVKKEHRKDTLTQWPFKITMLKESGYKKNISFKRFISHFIWGINVWKYLQKRRTPDVVYCAVPSLTGPLFAAKYCEKNKIKFIIDIQDLWPEAFKMIFNIPVISDLIFAPFLHIANGIYRRADVIYGVSDTYVNRALKVKKHCIASHTVFLGTDLNTYDMFVKNNLVQKPESELWIGYCGTLGASYDLKCVLDALVIIRNKGVEVPKFIVMGDGPRQIEFMQYAESKQLDVVFTGRLPYDKMCGMLSACDIAVNPIRRRSAGTIINKHADYAAAGIPVVNNQESEEYRSLVNEYSMGLNCKCGDSLDMAEKFIILIKSENLRLQMGKQARRCAEERFNRSITYKKIIDVCTEENS